MQMWVKGTYSQFTTDMKGLFIFLNHDMLLLHERSYLEGWLCALLRRPEKS